jgi:hypothetical protein
VSSPSTGYLGRVRESLTIGTVIALVIAVAGTVFAVIDASSDVYGDRPWGNGLLVGPSIVVGFATVQLVWKSTDAVLLQWGARVFGLNLIATVACSAAFALTYPFVTVQYGTGGFQYWLGEGWATIVFPSLLGFAFALLTTMACFVVIVMPYLALAKPRRLAAANMLDTDPSYEARNRVAGLVMVALIILVFLIPTLIIAFDGVAEIVGWVLIPVGVVAMIVVAVTQKTDRARRAASGTRSFFDKVADARSEPDAQPRRHR